MKRSIEEVTCTSSSELESKIIKSENSVSFSSQKPLQQQHNNHPGSTNGGCVWTCSDCKKLFTSKSNLKVHLRVHTRIKPYHCKSCNYSCMHHSSIKEHLSKIHPGTIHTSSNPAYVFNSIAVPDPEQFNSADFNKNAFIAEAKHANELLVAQISSNGNIATSNNSNSNSNSKQHQSSSSVASSPVSSSNTSSSLNSTDLNSELEDSNNDSMVNDGSFNMHNHLHHHHQHQHHLQQQLSNQVKQQQQQQQQQQHQQQQQIRRKQKSAKRNSMNKRGAVANAKRGNVNINDTNKTSSPFTSLDFQRQPNTNHDSSFDQQQQQQPQNLQTSPVQHLNFSINSIINGTTTRNSMKTPQATSATIVKYSNSNQQSPNEQHQQQEHQKELLRRQLSVFSYFANAASANSSTPSLSNSFSSNINTNNNNNSNSSNASQFAGQSWLNSNLSASNNTNAEITYSQQTMFYTNLINQFQFQLAQQSRLTDGDSN